MTAPPYDPDSFCAREYPLFVAFMDQAYAAYRGWRESAPYHGDRFTVVGARYIDGVSFRLSIEAMDEGRGRAHD